VPHITYVSDQIVDRCADTTCVNESMRRSGDMERRVSTYQLRRTEEKRISRYAAAVGITAVILLLMITAQSIVF